jgi:KDO2-lipid IV(A) lauroyltransferase
MFVVDRLPVGAVFAIARGAGLLGWLLDRRRRSVAERNLRQAFPTAGEGEIARLVRSSFRFVAEAAAESLCLPRLARRGAEEVRARCAVDGLEKLEEIRARGRGGLFVSGHLGSFEFLGAAMGLFGLPLHTVSRPLKNPLIARHVAKGREAWGQFLVPKRGALRWILPALRSGGNAAFLLDQNERKRPLFLPVFGRLAACDRSVAALALRLRLPVVIGYAVRTGRALRFRIVIEEAILPGEESEEASLARRIQSALERMILRNPDRYLWLHDRYRTRPPAERDPSEPAFADAGAAVGGGSR